MHFYWKAWMLITKGRCYVIISSHRHVVVNVLLWITFMVYDWQLIMLNDISIILCIYMAICIMKKKITPLWFVLVCRSKGKLFSSQAVTADSAMPLPNTCTSLALRSSPDVFSRYRECGWMPKYTNVQPVRSQWASAGTLTKLKPNLWWCDN